jgi:transposase
MSASTSLRPGRRPDPTLRSLWKKRLHHFEQSGQSASTFCSEQGLSLPSFYAWRRRLRCSDSASTPVGVADTADGPQFVPIRLLPTSTPIELVLPTGTVLRVPPGCDLAFVRSLVASLGDAPC